MTNLQNGYAYIKKKLLDCEEVSRAQFRTAAEDQRCTNKYRTLTEILMISIYTYIRERERYSHRLSEI